MARAKLRAKWKNKWTEGPEGTKGNGQQSPKVVKMTLVVVSKSNQKEKVVLEDPKEENFVKETCLPCKLSKAQ